VREYADHFPVRRWPYAAQGGKAWKVILKRYEIEAVKEKNPFGKEGYSPVNPDRR